MPDPTPGDPTPRPADTRPPSPGDADQDADAGAASVAQATIATYRAALDRSGEVVSFRLDGLDRTGVPVTSSSLVDRATGRITHHGNGYGATPPAAELSGLGELAEGVLTAGAVPELHRRSRRGSYRDLVAAQGADRVADPLTLCLPAGSSWTAEQVLTWLPMRRVRTGESVWVPQELALSDPAELADGVTVDTALVRPISNGLGAGLDEARALAHGLGEILQRHTNGLRFRALDARSPVIDPAGLPPRVTALVDRLRAAGVEPVLKHAGTTLGVVSTYVMGRDATGGEMMAHGAPGSAIMLTAGGEAAHPDAEISLVKALLEYANSRARKAFSFGPAAAARAVAPAAYWRGLDASGGEPRAVAAMLAWAELDTEQLRALTAPDTARSVTYRSIELDPPVRPAGQAALLEHLLAALDGYDVLAGTVEKDGVVAAKVLVPGLEVETLSYGRIGEANARAALEADLDLVRVQGAPSGTHTLRVRLTDAAEQRLGGRVWWSPTVADAIVGARYPLYREPPRHSVTV